MIIEYLDKKVFHIKTLKERIQEDWNAGLLFTNKYKVMRGLWKR